MNGPGQNDPMCQRTVRQRFESRFQWKIGTSHVSIDDNNFHSTFVRGSIFVHHVHHPRVCDRHWHTTVKKKPLQDCNFFFFFFNQRKFVYVLMREGKIIRLRKFICFYYRKLTSNFLCVCVCVYLTEENRTTCKLGSAESSILRVASSIPA